MPFDKNFWNSIDRLVSENHLVVDRPAGSTHPRYPQIIYPLDYGYLNGTLASDGDGVDVWLGSADQSVCDAVICSVDLNKQDAELKLLLGCTSSEQQTILAFHNTHEQHAILVERSVSQAAPREAQDRADTPATSAMLVLVTMITLAILITLPREVATVGFVVLVLASLATVYGPRIARSRGEWRSNVVAWARASRVWATQRRRSLMVAGLAMGGMGLTIGATTLMTMPDREVLIVGVFDHNDTFSILNDGRMVRGVAKHLSAVDRIWNNEIQTALILALVAWPLFGVASLLLKPKPDAMSPTAGALLPVRARYVPAAVGVFALALFSFASTDFLEVGLRGKIPSDLQFGLLIAGIGFLAWGISGEKWPPHRLRVAWRGLLPLGLITMVAFVIRVWNLEYSIHRFVDEIHFVNAINQFKDDPNIPLAERFSEVAAFPYLYPYLQSKFVALLGHSFAGFRMVSAVMGALTIPAVYWLARTLFDRRVAMLSAAVLAVLPVHIQFSRIGLNNIVDPLFGVLAMAFLARGLTSNRRSDFVWGGVMLGLTQYFYEGGRLLYPPVIAVWLMAVAVLSRGKVSWRALGVTVLVAGLVAAPVYLALIGDDAMVNPRIDEMGLDREYFVTMLFTNIDELWKIHLWHIFAAFLTLFYLPDVSWFYGDKYPMIFPVLVPSFWMGLGLSVWRWFKPGAMLLLIWLAAGLVGQSFLIASTQSPRFVVLLPALAMLIAMGVTSLLDFLEPLRSSVQVPRYVLHGVVAVLIVGAGVMQVTHYFGSFLDDYNALIRLGPDPEDALLRSLDFPPGTQVVIIGSTVLWPINQQTILTYFDADLDVKLVLPGELTYLYLANLSEDVDHAFYVERGDEHSIEMLYSFFDLEAPRGSQYEVPLDKQYALLYHRQVVSITDSDQ